MHDSTLCIVVLNSRLQRYTWILIGKALISDDTLPILNNLCASITTTPPHTLTDVRALL